MKFTVSSHQFLKDLQAISGSVGTGAVLPILENFLFKLKGNKLIVKASDLETTMTSEIQVEGSQDGTIAIPAKILTDTLKALPDQPLSLTADKNLQVQIKAKNGNYKLTGENGDDFPVEPEASNVAEVSIPGAMLADAINKSLFAVSADTMRPAMTGVFVEIEKGGTTFVATDAHKLVRYNNKTVKNDTRGSFIVPKRAMGLLKGAIDESADVTIRYNDASAFFEVGDNIQLVCRLIDSKFPDYNKAIPKGNDNILTINRNDLHNALRRISLFSSKTTNQVVFKLNKNKLKLSAKDLDYSNEASEDLTCQYDGDAMEIAFNAKFVLEILGALEDDDVEFQLANASRAGLIEPADKANGVDVTMLVMPIMLNS